MAGEIDGLLQPEESVAGILEVLAARTRQDSGSFWRWDGQVSGDLRVRGGLCLTRLATSVVSGINAYLIYTGTGCLELDGAECTPTFHLVECRIALGW